MIAWVDMAQGAGGGCTVRRGRCEARHCFYKRKLELSFEGGTSNFVMWESNKVGLANGMAYCSFKVIVCEFTNLIVCIMPINMN